MSKTRACIHLLSDRLRAVDPDAFNDQGVVQSISDAMNEIQDRNLDRELRLRHEQSLTEIGRIVKRQNLD